MSKRTIMIWPFVFMCLVACIGSPSEPQPTSLPPAKPTKTATPPSEQGGIVMPPAGMESYLQYLEVIREPVGPATDFVLEMTILSISQTDVCPYPEEECPILPYPNDWGLVRIDEILSEQTAPVEEGSATVNEGGEDSPRSTEPNQGIDNPTREQTPSLQVGQEVQAQFLYTTRPAIVRRVPVLPEDNNLERADAPPTDPPPIPTFQPLPQQDDHFVFIIGSTTSANVEDIRLPGLAVGDSIRAVTRFDGTLRVYEYELLP